MFIYDAFLSVIAGEVPLRMTNCGAEAKTRTRTIEQKMKAPIMVVPFAAKEKKTGFLTSGAKDLMKITPARKCQK